MEKSKRNIQKCENPKNDSKIELTDIFGECGRFQVTIATILIYAAALSNWNVIGYSFYTFPMDHWCSRPHRFENVSVESWKNYTLPKEIIHGKSGYDSCKMFDLSNVTDLESLGNSKTLPLKIIPCETWEFNTSYFKSTIISEWSLTCENSWLSSLSQSVYMAGFLTAVLLFGQLGDKYGRRPVLLICIILQQVAGIACAFSPNFIFFTVMRFFIAMGTHGFFTTAYVVLMELVSAPVRPKVGVSLGFGWSIGFLSLPLLGWFTRSWSAQQLVTGIGSVALSACFWLIPESPRWLITMGKYEEAKVVIERAAKYNKVYTDETQTVISKFFQQTENSRNLTNESQVKAKNATVLDLIGTPYMRNISLKMFLTWFVTAFVYYALSLNTHSMGGDPFLNIAIAGATELPCLLVYYLVITYFGRRKPLCVFLILAGVSCLLTLVVTENILWLRISLVMIGKACVSVCFGIIYMYSVELFPTVVRNVGVGSCSTSARIGSIIAPFVKELGYATPEFVPVLIYGGITILSGLLVLRLPETTDKTIPDTIDEAERMFKKK